MATNSIKPIRNEDDYEAALAEVAALWGAKSGTPKGDRLDVLATLIDAYESQHYPKDMEPLIGTRTRVAEVLNGRRSLSITMIRRLHDKLGIAAETLIRPTRAA